MRKIDITGKKFGRLTAVRLSHRNADHYFWVFKCDCGKETIKEKHKVRTGETHSCGCLRSEKSRERLITHGMGNAAKNKFYRTWRSMLNRTGNPNQENFKRYGGCGIKVCDRWLKFENFRDDMYELYLAHVAEFGERQTSIDRINNELGYRTDNCRWATLKEQHANRRPDRMPRKRKPDGRFV